MPYPFDQIFAADPERPEMVATNAPVVVFAPGDETKTPLKLTTLNGLPLENPITVNDRGFGPAFISDLDQVAWEGGGHTGLMASYRGLKDDAETAAQEAALSREAAEEAVRNSAAPTQAAVVAALTDEGPAKEAVSATVATAVAATTANLALKPDNGTRAIGKGELTVNVKDFGAKGDGTTDDSDALQRFFNHLATSGGRGYAEGRFLHRTPITLTNPARGFTLETAGRDSTVFLFRGTQNTSGLQFIGLHDVDWGACTIDGGLAETGFGGHGITIRNPDNVHLERVHARNYKSTGIILFANDSDAGLWGRSNIVDCSYDGMGVANNGILFAALDDCTMVRPVGRNLGRTAAHSPSYGAQLKNACYNCHIIDADIDGAKGGIVMASDQPDGGPEYCSATGQTLNCTEHIVMGKSKSSSVRGRTDMRGDSLASRAVAIGANSERNLVQVTLTGLGAASTVAPIFVNYSDNTVEVEHAGEYGARLVELGTSVRNNRVIVKSLAGSVSNPSSLVLDGSGNNTNQLSYAPALAAMTALSDTDASYLRMMSPTNSNTWLSFNHSSGQFSLRSQGADVFAANRTSVQPGADISQTLGTSGRRFTTIFAQTATINTSDARAKQDWEQDLTPELRAWAKVEFGKYRLNESVKEKGDGARWHFGVIAQQVKDAFESEGLDPFAYGILCHDEWDATDEVLDDEGNVIIEGVPAGDRYGIRYEEALILEAAYIRSRIG